MTVTAVDDSGNERSCAFDIFIPVDEHVLARTEVVETFAFPMERQYAEANALLFYSHRIVPAPDSPIQTLQVRLGCEKQTTPIPSTHINTRTHPHPCFSHLPLPPNPHSLNQADVSNFTRLSLSFEPRSASTPFVVRLLHAPEQVYFLVNVQYHADGIDAPSLHGQQGVLTDNKKGRDGCVCVCWWLQGERA